MNLRYIEDSKIRVLRTHIWVRAVRIKSKLSIIELENIFTEAKSSNDKSRSCIWDKYNRGDVVPRIGVKPNGELHLASRVERQYPGTLEWLTSPMWRLLDKAPMSMEEVRATYERMPKLIKSIFVEADYKITGIFWRRRVELNPCIKVLNNLDLIDAFIALLTMAKEAEITQDQYTHEYALKAAIKLTQKFMYIPIIDLHFMEIESYLNMRLGSAGYIDDDDYGE